jgi:hypothetical protein
MNDKKTEQTILIAVFLAMLLLPGADAVFHLAPRIKVPENRKLHEKPKLKWTLARLQNYPYHFEQYFNDHFGLRNVLIKGNCFLRAKLLKISTNRNIVFGKEGWLFTKLTYVSLDEKKLIKMQKFLERRVNYFNKQGIKYFLVIVPGTESIYPEYLSHALRLKKPNAYDQFRDHMSRHSKTDALIDVKKTLLENKHFRFPPEWETSTDADWTYLYTKLDQHWNSIGAYLAYREVARRLTEQYSCLKPFEPADMSIHSVQSRKRAVEMLGLDGKDYDDPSFYLKLKNEDQVTVQCPDVRLTIVGDSMVRRYMLRWFKKHFGFVTFIPKKLPSEKKLKKIKKSKPDIVIEERIERTMPSLFES